MAQSASDLRTVCVLGASYGGHRAVQVLVNNLPRGWRVAVIERNTHCNHLYVFPRIAVVPGHEHKAFIPYTNIFKRLSTLTLPSSPLADLSSHTLIHGHVTAVHPHTICYIPLDEGAPLEEREVNFDYLIYALGSHLPAPINIWSEEPLKHVPKLRTWGRQSSLASTPSSTPTIVSAPQTPSTTTFRSPFFALPSKINTATTSLAAFLSSSPVERNVPAWIRALGGLTTPSTPEPFAHVHDRGDYKQRNVSFDKDLRDRLENFSINGSSTKCDNSSEDEEIHDVLEASAMLQRGTKPEGVAWLRTAQNRVKNCRSVLVIGGGALGVQFATDIKHYYPEKKVTLVHSGPQLLPRFDRWLHDQIMVQMEKLGVDVMLSSRVDLSSKTKSRLRTCDGRLISAELILLCTGQKPNTSLLSEIAPHSINPRTGFVTVLRSMQIGYFDHPGSTPAFVSSTGGHGFMCEKGLGEDECHCRPIQFDFKLPNSSAGPSGFPSPSLGPIPTSPSKNAANDPGKVTDMNDVHVNYDKKPSQHLSSPYPHVFVVGDAADAFGALNAGHTAWAQAEVASRNIVRMIESNGRARVFDNTHQDMHSEIHLKSKGLREEERMTNRDTISPTRRAASVSLRTKSSTNQNRIWSYSPMNELEEADESGDPIPELEHYTAPPPSIKISIGLDKAIYQSKDDFGFKGPEECPVDLNTSGMWKRRGLGTEDMTI